MYWGDYEISIIRVFQEQFRQTLVKNGLDRVNPALKQGKLVFDSAKKPKDGPDNLLKSLSKHFLR